MDADIIDNSSGSYGVRTGIWTNWNHEAVYGAMLTLSRKDGSLLVAFIAVFITFVGTRTWRISCFIFHQIYSSKKRRDAFHHQRQAILRNSSEATSGLVTFLKLPWAWRTIAKGSLRRILPILLYAIIFTVAITLASVFSSRLATSTEVLIFGDFCGWLNISKGDYTGVMLLLPYLSHSVYSSASYARQCYTPDVFSLLGCNTFVTKQLPIHITKNSSCPFENNICRSNSTNLLLDTGYLDTHIHFGLNAPPDQRLQYRRVLHCSPLVTDGYKTRWNLSSDRSYTRYHHGTIGKANFTYEYTNDAIWEAILTNENSAIPDYNIGVRTVNYRNGSLLDGNQDEFIPELRKRDADVTIYYLSANAIMFTAPTADDWYRATKKEGPLEAGEFVYFQDEPASPLACAQQEQFCMLDPPEGKRCTPLSGFNDGRINAAALVEDKPSENRMEWLLNSVLLPAEISTDVIVNFLGSQALTSKQSLSSGVQAPIPDNQWQLDVEYWFAVSLASLQQRFIDTVAGLSDTEQQQRAQISFNTEGEGMCRNQKIVSTAHISFSFFGIILIGIFGCVLIIASFTLESAIFFFKKRCGLDDYAQLEWCTNHMLQLQRLAHEEICVGTWSHATEDIPVTKSGELLAALDLADREHPRLQMLSDQSSETDGEATTEEAHSEESDLEGWVAEQQSSGAAGYLMGSMPHKHAVCENTSADRESVQLISDVSNNHAMPTRSSSA